MHIAEVDICVTTAALEQQKATMKLLFGFAQSSRAISICLRTTVMIERISDDGTLRR